jgi:hypothetical protein
MFSAADLAGKKEVVCPRCGMGIQLRVAAPAVAPPPPTAPPPMATAIRPTASAPMATPVATAMPVTPPAPPPAHTAPVDYTPELPPDGEPGGQPIVIARRGANRGSGKLQPLLIAGAIIGFIGLIVGGIYSIVNRTVGSDGGVPSFVSEQYNYTLRPPGSQWKRDDETREEFKVSLFTIKRANPSAWVAMHAFDYGSRNPTPRELEEEARNRLGRFFKNLESDPAKGEPIKATADIAGQKALRIVFRGDVNETAMSGECLMFSHQGIGYWFYGWTPATEVAAGATEFEAIRSKFSLSDRRANWKKDDKRRKVYEGKAATYTLTDPEGRWQHREPATDYDPKADLALYGPDRQEPRNIRRSAELLVLVLPSSGDAVAAAQAHILEKHKRDGFEMTKIEKPDDGDAGDKVGSASGKLIRWRIENDRGRIRFALVGVVNTSKDTIVIYAECDWIMKTTWEPQFRHLIDSFTTGS